MSLPECSRKTSRKHFDLRLIPLLLRILYAVRLNNVIQIKRNQSSNCWPTIHTAIKIFLQLLQVKMKHLQDKGSFNNYVDQISPNFDPLPPWVDNCGHFTWYLTFVTWPSMDFLLTPSPSCPCSYWMTPNSAFIAAFPWVLPFLLCLVLQSFHYTCDI